MLSNWKKKYLNEDRRIKKKDRGREGERERGRGKNCRQNLSRFQSPNWILYKNYVYDRESLRGKKNRAKLKNFKCKGVTGARESEF